MNNKILLESMALDLKRIALGAKGNSQKMTDRFIEEVMKRERLLMKDTIPSSLEVVIENMKKKLISSKHLADDALMFSTILLSYSKQIE